MRARYLCGLPAFFHDSYSTVAGADDSGFVWHFNEVAFNAAQRKIFQVIEEIFSILHEKIQNGVQIEKVEGISVKIICDHEPVGKDIPYMGAGYAQLIFQEKADLFMQLFFQERIESSTDNAPYQFDHVTEIIAVFSP